MSAQIATLSSAEVALSAATARTIVQLLAPTNQRLKVKAWGVYFDGVSATAEPVQVRLLRQTTAGTMSALTPIKVGVAGSETLQATGQTAATVEPAASNTLKRVEVHPQGGYEEVCAAGDEYIVEGAGRVGIECTAPATVNVIGWLRYEE